jgi:hypothetical protein
VAASTGAERSKVLGRVRRDDYVERARGEPGVELSGYDEPVASVIALSAYDDDAMIAQWGETFGEKLDDPVAGVLHEDGTRQSELYRAPVGFAHLLRCEDVHPPS